jgi:hypothetical protein
MEMIDDIINFFITRNLPQEYCMAIEKRMTSQRKANYRKQTTQVFSTGENGLTDIYKMKQRLNNIQLVKFFASHVGSG